MEDAMSVINTLVKQGLKQTPLRTAMSPAETVVALFRVPSIARLVFALFQDTRVPLWNKGGALLALAAVISPFDLLEWIPVLGEVSDFLLALFILDMFIKLSPAAVVNEHIQRLNLAGKIQIRG
jgi:uncharacterized membrane protein YkvA (DUF1232 family)